MEKRTSAFARILAALALIAAVVVTVVAISGALGGNSSSDNGHHHATHKTKKQQPKHPRSKAATYEVESGDTLISIAHKTGVPLAELEELNPNIDPQNLIVGETLKLR